MLLKYRRILLKLSGEAMGSSGQTIDFDAVGNAAEQIAEVARLGVEVGVVVGGGNIWRGRSGGKMDRNRADHMGMLATAINALAMQDALEQRGVPCAVLSAVPMQAFCEPYTAREANRLLAQKTVVIFACGTGCPFFSTDTTAALRAAETGADVLLLAKNVDAVYSADPNAVPGATRYSHVSYDTVIEKDLKATDLTAITLCREQNIPILVFGMRDGENIKKAVSGESVGTLIDRG
ncbi:MAG: UMP kinase [Bacillota bacterium]